MLTSVQIELQRKARDLARCAFVGTAESTDATESYPWNNVEKLRAAGFMGMTIPAAYGGAGAELPRCGAGH